MSAGIHKATSKLTKEARSLQLAVVKQMLTLTTAGFGLVAALAWNEMIKETVNTYVKPYLPHGSGVISLFMYAVIVTVLAVTITFNLSRLQKRLEDEQEEKKSPSKLRHT